MRLRIRHVTTYDYGGTVAATTQVARLAPRDDGGQRVERWSVLAETGNPGEPWRGTSARSIHAGEDGYGNRTHLVAVATPHSRFRVVAAGIVRTAPAWGPARIPAGTLPPSYWLRVTRHVAPGPEVRRLLRDAGIPDGTGSARRWHAGDVEGLVRRVRDRIDFRTGATDVSTTADEALGRGAGVCQDHAHALVAVARAAGIPARYVSGYLWPGRGATAEASHAWVDVHLDDLGWASYDPANACRATEAHVRVATGLDYFDAPPVRGVRHGGLDERLGVSVVIDEIDDADAPRGGGDVFDGIDEGGAPGSAGALVGSTTR